MGGAALYLAAQMVLSKGRALAAHLLQADASEVSFSAGRFTIGSGERGIDLLRLAEAARDPANLPNGMIPGLDADAFQRYAAHDGPRELSEAFAAGDRDGVFGVPTFIVDGEPFWGNDRVEWVVKKLDAMGLRRESIQAR